MLKLIFEIAVRKAYYWKLNVKIGKCPEVRVHKDYTKNMEVHGRDINKFMEGFFPRAKSLLVPTTMTTVVMKTRPILAVTQSNAMDLDHGENHFLAQAVALCVTKCKANVLKPITFNVMEITGRSKRKRRSKRVASTPDAHRIVRTR